MNIDKQTDHSKTPAERKVDEFCDQFREAVWDLAQRVAKHNGRSTVNQDDVIVAARGLFWHPSEMPAELNDLLID